MPRQESPRLKFSYGWLRGEDWWGDPVSDNFVRIDMLLNPVIVSKSEVSPPAGGVAVGDMFIVAGEGAGAWAERGGQLAMRTAAGWAFATPTRGVRARLNNPSGWIWFTGQEWLDEGSSGDTPTPILGTRYDIALSVGFEAEPLEALMMFVVPEPMTLPPSAVGSRGRYLEAPAGIVRLVIRRNGADVGTITFAPNNVNSIFTVMTAVEFATNDILSIHTPDVMPVGFKNYGATLRLILKQNGG